MRRFVLVVSLLSLGVSAEAFRPSSYLRPPKYSRLCSKNRDEEKSESDIGKFFEELYIKVQKKLSEGKKFEFIAWAFKYGDTRPFTEKSLVGWLFLATNLCYLLSSINLWQVEEGIATTYGIIIDTAGLFSFVYHYTQLQYGPNRIG